MKILDKTKPTMCGIFTLSAVNIDTGEERHLAGPFENLLLDGGLNACGNTPMFTTCSVGSGSAAPVNTNSSLQAFIASTTSIAADVSGGDPSGYGFLRRTWQFAAGAAAGNLSEIGIGASSTNLLSRSLIKDGDGSPTSITVLSNEFFNVTYEIRLYPPSADVTFHATIAGVDTVCTMRAAEIGSDVWAPWLVRDGAQAGNPHGANLGFYDGDIGAATGIPSGTQTGATIGFAAYVNNALAIVCGSTVVPLGSGNYGGGIKSMWYRTGVGSWQVSFNPTIAKDNTKTLQMAMSAAWTRNS